MNQRILILLALLFAAAAVILLFVLVGPSPEAEDEFTEIRRGTSRRSPSPTRRTAEGAQREEASVPEGAAGGPARSAGAIGGVPAGLRVPEGVDLSDPEQVRALLMERLSASPTDWKDVARLAALYHEPLDAATRERLLNELVGGRRGQVLKVFQATQDATLVADLLQRLDDESVTGNARSALLTALATLPRADAGEVVRGLEARLSGNARKDAVVLRAIGQRGGAEAARAITSYIADSDDPMAATGRSMLRLSLKDDPEASAVLATALAETRSDAALGALIRIATQPGASGVVESLVGLDSPNVAPELRTASLRALAVIGTEDAVDHVLASANGADDSALAAIKSLGVMTAAEPAARKKLMESLESPASGVYADERRLETLRALANLKHKPAKDAFLEALDDRDPQVQIVAAQGLGRVGETARDHVDDLVRVFSSGSEGLQRSVVVALGQIGGEEAAGVLRQLQTREDLSTSLQRAVRMAVIRAEKGRSPADDREERLGGR